MKVSDRINGIVIGCVAIAFVGLVIIQTRWLNQTIAINKQIFQQKVDLISDAIGVEFNKHKSSYNKQLLNRDGEFDKHIRTIIDTVMLRYNLETDYAYGLYRHAPSQEGLFYFVKGSQVDSKMTLPIECNLTKPREYGWTNLSCSREYDDAHSFHMATFFPRKDQYIFSQVKNGFIISVLFIVILVSCFAYTFITIRKQKRLSEIKNDFINNLTHEFKTPIFSIGVATRILKGSKELTSSSQHARSLEVIDMETSRLRNQVDKVLQIAMLDSGNFKLEQKPVDIHVLIAKSSKVFELVIEETRGNLQLDLRAARKFIVGDELHLSNVLYNLLDNSIKYSSGPPEIVISTFDTKDSVGISVRDNGIGMKKEVQQLIFDKFYRASTGDIHSVKGFGLGLSYVKGIVEAHKGLITLTSEQNKGSDFTFYLPAT